MLGAELLECVGCDANGRRMLLCLTVKEVIVVCFAGVAVQKRLGEGNISVWTCGLHWMLMCEEAGRR